MSKDERKNFYRTVAKGLMRPLFSVYRRVTRMYDQKNYMGKYTVEEIDLLKEWVELEWFQKLLFIILHKFQDSTTFVLDGSKPLAPDNTVGQRSELQSFDDEAVDEWLVTESNLADLQLGLVTAVSAFLFLVFVFPQKHL